MSVSVPRGRMGRLVVRADALSTDGSLLLAHDIASLRSRFPMLPDNMAAFSSRD
jgi:hypothetical protein